MNTNVPNCLSSIPWPISSIQVPTVQKKANDSTPQCIHHGSRFDAHISFAPGISSELNGTRCYTADG